MQVKLSLINDESINEEIAFVVNDKSGELKQQFVLAIGHEGLNSEIVIDNFELGDTIVTA